MNEEANNLTCAAFQDQLPELIASGESAANHPHVQSCELCRALLADLETIAQAARELFPVEEPSESLWENIASAIQGDKPPAEAEATEDNEVAAAAFKLPAEPA